MAMRTSWPNAVSARGRDPTTSARPPTLTSGAASAARKRIRILDRPRQIISAVRPVPVAVDPVVPGAMPAKKEPEGTRQHRDVMPISVLVELSQGCDRLVRPQPHELLPAEAAEPFQGPRKRDVLGKAHVLVVTPDRLEILPAAEDEAGVDVGQPDEGKNQDVGSDDPGG